MFICIMRFALMKWLWFVENSQRGLSGEFTNETTTDDNGGYYNTTELAKFIRVENLQRVIREKSNDESNVFLSEYKVLFRLNPISFINICWKQRVRNWFNFLLKVYSCIWTVQRNESFCPSFHIPNLYTIDSFLSLYNNCFPSAIYSVTVSNH